MYIIYIYIYIQTHAQHKRTDIHARACTHGRTHARTHALILHKHGLVLSKRNYTIVYITTDYCV